MEDFDPEGGMLGTLKEFARRPLRDGGWAAQPPALDEFLQRYARTGRPRHAAWQEATQVPYFGNPERPGSDAWEWMCHRPL